jgi:hypothetical protein
LERITFRHEDDVARIKKVLKSEMRDFFSTIIDADKKEFHADVTITFFNKETTPALLLLIKNTTDEYRSVYTVKKNDTNLNNQSNRFILNTDSLYFLVPPDYYTDSIYLCFEHINSNIDTVGLCYKRKLFIKREYSKQAFDMEVYDSKIFYLSPGFDKDSSIIKSENTSNYNGNINLRIYNK